MRNKTLVVVVVAIAAAMGLASCSSSNNTSSTATTAGTTAGSSAPSSTAATSSGTSTAGVPSAAQLQQQAAAEGLALSPQQAECIVGQAQQFAQAATFFGSKGSVSFSEAQVVVGVLNQCYGSQQAFGQAFVGALQKQDPSLSAADATCLGQAIGSMSTDDVAYLLADQQSSMSTAAKSAMQKCLSSSSSTSNP